MHCTLSIAAGPICVRGLGFCPRCLSVCAFVLLLQQAREHSYGIKGVSGQDKMTTLLNALSSKRWGEVQTPQQSPVSSGGLVSGNGGAGGQVRADAGGASADQLGAPQQALVAILSNPVAPPRVLLSYEQGCIAEPRPNAVRFMPL